MYVYIHIYICMNIYVYIYCAGHSIAAHTTFSQCLLCNIYERTYLYRCMYMQIFIYIFVHIYCAVHCIVAHMTFATFLLYNTSNYTYIHTQYIYIYMCTHILSKKWRESFPEKKSFCIL